MVVELDRREVVGMCLCLSFGFLLLLKIRLVDTERNRSTAVGALMLSKVITPGKFLSAIGALERLVLGVKRPVVALQVLLPTESTRADLADKGLAGILCQGLLAAAASG